MAGANHDARRSVPRRSRTRHLNPKWETRPAVAHSNAGSRHTFFRHAQRPTEIGAAPSVGPISDSTYDAVAGSTTGPHEAELVRRHGPWKTLDNVELDLPNAPTGSSTALGSLGKERIRPSGQVLAATGRSDELAVIDDHPATQQGRLDGATHLDTFED